MIWILALFGVACAPEPQPPEQDCPLRYADLDGDGYGNPDDAVASCEPIAGRVDNAEDCWDRDADLNEHCLVSCANAPLVPADQLLACEDTLVRVSGALDGLPDGGCVCSVETLLLNDPDVDPVSIAGLQAVRNLSIGAEAGDLSFDSLAKVTTLTAPLDGSKLSLPTLRTAHSLTVQGAGELRLSSLDTVESLAIVDLRAASLSLPALDEVQTLTLHSGALETLALGPRASVEWLVVDYCDDLEHMSGGYINLLELHRRDRDVQRTITSSVRKLWWWGQHRAELTMTAGPSVRVEKEGSGTLSVDGLSPETTTLSKGTLELPSQVELDYIWTGEGSTLRAPSLRWVSSAGIHGDCELPALEEVTWMYVTPSCDPPQLTWVGTLHGQGTLSALQDVGEGRDAWVVLPSLTEARGTGTLSGREGNLPALNLVDGDLYFNGAVLPALRRVEGELRVNGGLVEVPALQHTDGLLVTGKGDVVVEQDWDFPLRVDKFSGSLEMGRVNTPVLVRNQGWDARSVVPHLAFEEIHGNLTVIAILWETVDIQVGELHGDLLYCIPQLPEEQAQAWVKSIEMTGQAKEICTW